MSTAIKDISSPGSLTTVVSAPRVLIAAGGTGGHVYPAIAIADALKELRRDVEILFAGTRERMEWQAVPKAGYAIKSIWISGFHRRFTLQNLLFPVKLLSSMLQSRKLLKRFNPDIVIACGGFASGPVGWVAAKMGIPLLLQEQNSYPGVTNRLLAKHSDAIFTAFEEAEKYLPKEKIIISGNPVRASFRVANRDKALDTFGLTDSLPVLLITGGSGGARSLNDAVEVNLKGLHDKLQLQIIWQCGDKYYDDLAGRIDEKKFPGLRLMKYIDDMPAAYSAADLAICRAGAGTCSELTLTGTPSILVPSPHVAGDHQRKNAEAMVSGEAGVLLQDSCVTNDLLETVENLVTNEERLLQMSEGALRLARPEASAVIANEILNRIRKRI